MDCSRFAALCGATNAKSKDHGHGRSSEIDLSRVLVQQHYVIGFGEGADPLPVLIVLSLMPGRGPQRTFNNIEAAAKPDSTPRSQFLHVNDIVPTIYDVAGIAPPRVVNGVPQDAFDGVSMASTFNDAKAAEVKHAQYFEIMRSRGIYSDGWMASAFGPRTPWLPGLPKGILEWTPDKDTWELYKIDEDRSQASDLASKMPAKLADMKDLFLIELARNNGLPVGGGLWVPAFHPELRLAPPYNSWTFPGAIVRMPEFAAPAE
jgi:hypothetical protein